MRKGFTLIEILATITIATLLVTPILRLMDSGTKGVYKGAERTTAILAAADLIEAIRGVEFAVIPPRPPDQYYSVPEIRQMVASNLRRNLPFFNQYEDKFLIGIAISEIRPENDRNPAAPSKLRLVAIQVMWKNVMGGEESITVSSMITDSRAD
ncbi:MAG: prepilin-type N-terminal cleavage/methylation domain-containing protein [Candidatus Cloacimonetes bacterium]|nr:prepilin-type N-terminal cleavage/methylation domain-containing protein [Candidatus Cloacimonadota bacterium]